MGRKANDLTGQQFGYLYVLCRSERKDTSRHTYWACRCTLCGTIKDLRSDVLLKEIALSCGCYRPKHYKKRRKKWENE